MAEILKNLEEAAQSIPSMGGKELADSFNRYIAEMPNGLDVIEIGAWLGAGTSQMALALIRNGKDKSSMYIYDRFKITKSEREKAEKQGLIIKAGKDSLSHVKKTLAPFAKYVPMYFKKTDAHKATYKGKKKIGLFVLDTAKRGEQFDAVIKHFKKHFIPGVTICFFMDYYYYLHREDESLKHQKDAIESSGKYTEIETNKKLSVSIQRYTG
jgi:hypothetical protein